MGRLPSGGSGARYALYAQTLETTTLLTRTDQTTATVSLEPGAYSIVVAARNLWGESPKSDAVQLPTPAGKPKGLRIVVTVEINQ